MPDQLPPVSSPDPLPQEWCTEERLEQLQSTLAQSLDLLTISGQLPTLLGYWVRLELSMEACADERIWPRQEREAEVATLCDTWLAQRDPAAARMTKEQLVRKLAVQPGSLRWAEFQWHQRLDSLFLARKAELDQASCRLLRLSDKFLAQELYHRVLAGEASFEELAGRFGEGPERSDLGLVPMQSLSRLPLGLMKLLPSLRPGEVTAPQRLGKGFALVQLLQWQPATRNADTDRLLLKQELQAWVGAVVLHLQHHLGLPQA